MWNCSVKTTRYLSGTVECISKWGFFFSPFSPTSPLLYPPILHKEDCRDYLRYTLLSSHRPLVSKSHVLLPLCFLFFMWFLMLLMLCSSCYSRHSTSRSRFSKRECVRKGLTDHQKLWLIRLGTNFCLCVCVFFSTPFLTNCSIFFCYNGFYTINLFLGSAPVVFVFFFQFLPNAETRTLKLFFFRPLKCQ